MAHERLKTVQSFKKITIQKKKLEHSNPPQNPQNVQICFQHFQKSRNFKKKQKKITNIYLFLNRIKIIFRPENISCDISICFFFSNTPSDQIFIFEHPYKCTTIQSAHYTRIMFPIFDFQYFVHANGFLRIYDDIICFSTYSLTSSGIL